jgi:thaumarchaeosortase
VIASNVYNVDPAISTSALQAGVPSSNIGWFWLATEYLILTILFALTILIQYGVEGLGEYAISILFLGTIGGIYTIDNLYPFESFTPFQIIVPTTTMLAIGMLNFMGYHTLWVRTTNNMPLLIAESPQGKFSPGLWIAWPCSGVESLIIYTITMSLFLKKSGTSWIFKIASFSLGAVVTYLINGFRIATIFMIAADGGNWRYFHDYYGQLYSITWILCYPLIIIGALSIWRMIKYRRLAASQNNLNPQVKGIIQA